MSKTKQYDIAEGVTRINGMDVGDAKTIDLTDAEAKFDLAQGRLTLSSAKPAKKQTKADKKPDNDTGSYTGSEAE